MNISNWIDAFRHADGPPPQTLWAFMRWCLSGAWPALWLAAFFSAAAGALEAGTALILGRVIDATVTLGPDGFFAVENIGLIVGSVAFFLIARPVLFGLSSGSNSIIVMPNVNPLVLSRLNRWTLGQAVTFFDDDFAGRIAQKQMQASRAVTDVVSEFINVVAFALASLLGSVLLLLTIDWRVAAGFAVWLIAYFSLIRWFLPRIRKRSATRAAARAMVSGQVVDTITNIKTVKLFAHDDHEDQAALNAMEVFRSTAISFGVLSAYFRLALMTLAGLLPVLLLGGTIVIWQVDQASPGDIVASGAIAIRIAQMTGWVSFTLMTIYANIGEVEDGMRTLTPRTRLEDIANAEPLKRVCGDIKFDALGFSYGRKTGGLDTVSLHIMPGEKIGIVGASGAGKSTLVNLLLRLYEPEKGRILIDDEDIAFAVQDSLRRSIGVVTQETAMFNRSVRENILYGRPDATEEEIIASARKAEAEDFILEMQDHRGRKGYDAHLGERGIKLSGGQRQRIALARAIIKDAPILVLDEATSALDSEVEASIQTALNRVMDGKTVLAIAHRLSTLTKMDRIIVMDAGRIFEEGSHEDLLARNGLYAKYWQRQSGGFIRTEAAE
ncbi:MAG: ABC transporter ATP-binding protein [Tateyamaria sp.]|nr:ABC transporter ATP-binding protein [Tateyamaria sp.]MBT7799687.1 ABC transporter ATP-binding protein [Tateyamaria sp.]